MPSPKCPKCGAELLGLSSQRKRICSCGYEEEWVLEDGRPPLVTTNRDKRKWQKTTKGSLK